ncbi:MAG: 5'/3'-nucleotidase SurE [Dichotomicrobium sp.]
MRILVTNDDGIEAPGLDVLQAIAGELSDDVWVVAPETDQSGAAHSLTLHEPMRLRQLKEGIYAVKGTPTDCVIMGVRFLLSDHRPDLILSGVNSGQNIADDVTYSGTIAGAIEGTLLGIPSVALSLSLDYSRPGAAHWETPMKLGPGLIRRLLEIGWSRGVLMNVNFPDRDPDDVGDVVVTEQGKRDADFLQIEDRMDTRGNPYYWLGFKERLSPPGSGTDLRALQLGHISVTALNVNMTDQPTTERLRAAFRPGEDV